MLHVTQNIITVARSRYLGTALMVIQERCNKHSLLVMLCSCVKKILLLPDSVTLRDGAVCHSCYYVEAAKLSLCTVEC